MGTTDNFTWDTEYVFNCWNDEMTKLCRVKCNVVKHKNEMLAAASDFLGEPVKTWELTGTAPQLVIDENGNVENLIKE